MTTTEPLELEPDSTSSSETPISDALTAACGQSPSRFLIELTRWRGALVLEHTSGLTLSRGQSPRLRRTVSGFLAEAVGPDPRWIAPAPRNLGSLIVVLDAYVMQQQFRYGMGEEFAVRHSVMATHPDAFTETQKQRWSAVRAFCIATWPVSEH